MPMIPRLYILFYMQISTRGTPHSRHRRGSVTVAPRESVDEDGDRKDLAERSKVMIPTQHRRVLPLIGEGSFRPFYSSSFSVE